VFPLAEAAIFKQSAPGNACAVQVDTAAAALAVVVKALEVVAYNRAGSLSTHGNCRLFRT
jgi:hypothetical protein